MEEQKKVNPLATEKEGKLIAKFAIPAIISMLVSSLYNIVDQIFIGQGVGLLGNAADKYCISGVDHLYGNGAFAWNGAHRILICAPERGIMRKQAELREPDFPCW